MKERALRIGGYLARSLKLIEVFVAVAVTAVVAAPLARLEPIVGHDRLERWFHLPRSRSP